MLRALPIQPGLDVIHPADEQRDPRRLAASRPGGARLVATAGQAQRDDADAVVGAGNQLRRARIASIRIDVADHQQRLLDAGRDVRIEAAGLGVRGDRLLEQAAVAARVDQAGEQLGIVAVPARFAEQAAQRRRRLADVRLEVGVELVRDRQARVDGQGAAQRVLGPRVAARIGIDVLADDAMAAAEPGPRRREARIELEALLVEIARRDDAVVSRAPARWRAGTARRPADCAGRSGDGAGVPASGSESASATRRAMSSCRPKRSPSDAWTVCDVSSVPPGASTSWAVARS